MILFNNKIYHIENCICVIHAELVCRCLENHPSNSLISKSRFLILIDTHNCVCYLPGRPPTKLLKWMSYAAPNTIL